MQDVIGLENKSGPIENMIETSMRHGTLLEPLDEVAIDSYLEQSQGVLQTTGWVVCRSPDEDGIIKADGETRCIVTVNGHVTVTKLSVDLLKFIFIFCLTVLISRNWRGPFLGRLLYASYPQ